MKALFLLISLLALPLPGICGLRVAGLTVDAIDHAAFTASDIRLAVTLLPAGFALEGTIGQLRWPGAEAPLQNVQIKCNHLVWQDDQWRCKSARLKVQDSPYGPLNAPFSFVYFQQSQRIDLSGQLDLAPHSKAFASFGPQFELKGKMEYALQIYYQPEGVVRLTGRIALSGVNVSEPNGEMGCEGLSLVVRPDITITPDAITVSGTAEVTKGAVLYVITETTMLALDTLTADLNLRLAASYQRATTQLDIQDFHLDHAPIVALSLTARLYPLLPFTLESVKSATVNLAQLDIAPFIATYALPGLDPGNWQVAGQVQGHLEHHQATDSRLALNLSNVSVSEKFFERLTVQGLNGIVNLSRHHPEVSRLRWESLAVKRFITGATRFAIYTHATQVKIPALKLPFSHGALELKNIVCTQCLDPNRRISAAAQMVATPLSVFAPLMGENMPPISGEVNVTMPSLTYQNDRVDMAGQVVVDVFGGQIVADDLSLDGMTGRVPRMGGTVTLSKIDLEELTKTVNFGRITGRINGHVRDIELISWVPVAFDAGLYSTPGDKTRKRISQKAVDALTEIGGAGGALAQSYLRFFQEFSYANLGISCRLQGDVCHLGGVEQSDEGFYILKGYGLPYISIMGDRSQTSWSELMDKIRVIVSSQPSSTTDAREE